MLLLTFFYVDEELHGVLILSLVCFKPFILDFAWLD